jgi:CRISPR system Cascade subunit CasD
MRHLILSLEAPLMAFGGETIDNYGVIRWFPSASMLTGLLANALGWRRVEQEQHQRLQDRLVFAARIDREPATRVRLTDFQTVQLSKKDQGWTTRGVPEGRAGGKDTYDAPHLRYRDYFADMRVSVALRLEPEDETPTLDDLAAALQEPTRPLFIGRKPCLPSGSLFGGFVQGDTALAALLATPLSGPSHVETIPALWPDGEGKAEITPSRSYMLTDQRNWLSGLHGGGRLVCEGTIEHGRFSTAKDG